MQLPVQNDLPLRDVTGQIRDGVGDNRRWAWSGWGSGSQNPPVPGRCRPVHTGWPVHCTDSRGNLYGKESLLWRRKPRAWPSQKEVISVRITRICIPFSKARYSAALRATFGVIRRSTTGSLASSGTSPHGPTRRFLLKGTAEELCHVVFNAHGGKYDGEFVSSEFSPREACCTIWAASRSWGRPFPEKIGQLLSADQSGQTVDGGNTGPDIVSRILSGHGI